MVTEHVIRDTPRNRHKMPCLIVEEGLPICDKDLQVSHLWPVDCRIADFRYYAVPHGEPDA